ICRTFGRNDEPTNPHTMHSKLAPKRIEHAITRPRFGITPAQSSCMARKRWLPRGPIVCAPTRWRRQGGCRRRLPITARRSRSNPISPAATGYRGLLLADMGRYEDAFRDFETALRQNPNSQYTLTARGDVLEKIGRHEEALADYAQAIKSAHDSYDKLIAGNKLFDKLIGEARMEESR